MIQYPVIDPVAFHLGPIAVHWYGLMYLLGFAAAWLLAWYRANQPQSGWTSEQISDLIFYCAVGVIIGGRLGYFLFYDFMTVIQHPLTLFKLWEGGMSFHGGLLGVIIALIIFSYRYKKSIVNVMDFTAPLVPIGLGAGRLGNFINGELWGRVTQAPWGIVFPNGGSSPRHPSQIYEFLLEGVVLFLIIWWFSSKKRPPFAVSALFLLCYGLFRFIVEFFREPDQQVGFLFGNWLTMGQILSLPMIIIGISSLVYIYSYRKRS